MADIAELIVALKLRDDVSPGLGRLNGQLRGMQGGLSQVGQGIGQVGHGLGTVLTRGAIAAAAGIGAVVTAAASQEEAFIGVEKTVEATDAQFTTLRQNLRGMSGETGTSFEELARIGETAGALGVPISSMEDFIDVVNRLGVSTDLSTDEAATALGQLGTILHLEGEEFRSFGDTLVALGNAGASTEPQIIDLAARFAAAGNRAGLSSDEILALSSAVASMGVEVEAGGTALSQTFNEVALAIGTGSEEATAFADVLGVSAGEFRRRWETDALGTFQDFLEEISKLDPIAQAVALEMAGITGTRQLSAVGLMADNYGFVADQLNVARTAEGELAEESDKFFGSTVRGFAKLRENLRNSAAAIGTEMLPVVNELTAELVDFLNQPGTQASLKEFGTDMASGIRGLVTELKGTDFTGILSGLQLTAQVAKSAFDAFRSLPAPIQQLAIAALAANKLTGGAVGSIAAGLGNIVLGSLKTIMAGNVTVIGGNVTGGPGGGGGGGGLLGGLKAGVALASPVLAGIAAVEVVNFTTMREQAMGGLQTTLDGMRRDTGASANSSISAINSQINQERPLLEGILFNTNVRPQLEAERTELINTRNTLAANIVRGTDHTSWAIDRVNATMNLERAASAAYEAADAARIQSLRDSHALAIAGVTARLDTANVHLGGISGGMGTFARLREGPPTVINNVISSTVIQQQTAQTNTLSGLNENRY